MPHLEFTSGYFGGGYNLKIPGRHEVPDFQLALAHNCQRRRLHPANSDHAARTLPENDRRSASEGEVVNLVSLTTCYCRGVEAGIFRIGFCVTKCVPDCLRILRCEQHSHDLASVFVMLEYFLADQLAFTVAVGGEPNSLCSSECLADNLELGSLVATIGRARGVQPFRAEKDRRPAFPFRNYFLWFLQIKQMAFGRQDVAITRSHGGTDVFRLASLLGDDDLISHARLRLEGSI